MKYEDLKQKIRDRWDNKNQGVPLSNKFPRLSKTISSWDNAEATLLLGGSGTGKTKFVFKVVVLDSLEYMKNNPNKMEVFILINSLELTELEMYVMYLCYLFKTKLKKKITREYLLNKFQFEKIDGELFEDLETLKPDINFFNKYVTIYDNKTTADSWYLECKSRLLQEGKLDAFDKYVKNSNNKHFIIVTDTLNAFSIPNGSNKLQEMMKFSSVYMKQMLRNKYQTHCITLQQLDKSSQQNQFSQKGTRIEEKLLPQASDAKDYKSSEDDNSLVLAIFLPHKYRLEKWEGYPVDIFEGKLSFIYILKSNFTYTSINEPIAMYVDHSTLEYEEIPSHSDLPDSDYQKFLKEKGIIAKEKNVDSKLKLLLKQ